MICRKCNLEKPVDAFYAVCLKNRNHICKPCSISESRRYLVAKLEHYKKFQPEKYQDYLLKKRIYRKSHPDRIAGTRTARIPFIKSKNFTCESCGLYEQDPRFFDIDHIIPINNSRNRSVRRSQISDGSLQLLCPNCHRRKTIIDRENGLIIHPRYRINRVL
jgi:5-methylcytosine-specific restriction endonuclease McrA